MYLSEASVALLRREQRCKLRVATTDEFHPPVREKHRSDKSYGAREVAASTTLKFNHPGPTALSAEVGTGRPKLPGLSSKSGSLK